MRGGEEEGERGKRRKRKKKENYWVSGKFRLVEVAA